MNQKWAEHPADRDDRIFHEQRDQECVEKHEREEERSRDLATAARRGQ